MQKRMHVPRLQHLRRYQRGIFGIDDFLVATIGSSLVGGLLGMEGQESANQTNVQLGREQMAFQERMSNTAYPRAVQGMKDAGLNPMLAYSQGGASTPVGSMPQVQNTATAGLTSAAQAAAVASTAQQIQQSKAQTDLTAATAAKVRAETLENSIHNARALAELELTKGRTGETFWHANKLRLEGPGAGWDSETKEARFKAMEKGGGFTAETTKLREEARLRELERAKEQIMKLPYDVFADMVGPAKNSARRERDRLNQTVEELLKPRRKQYGATGSW